MSTVKKSSSNKMRAYGGAVGAVCATAMVALAVANGGSASSLPVVVLRRLVVEFFQDEWQC